MQIALLSTLLLTLLLLLPGCAGFGIVATSDPLAKLNDAEDLFMRQQRPLPAERLIFEAMAIYQERNDPHGLGHAHREYGDLLRSPSVVKWEKVYRRDGFQDRTVTFGNRVAKASEYYSKALEYYKRAEAEHRHAEKYDLLINVYLNMGWSYYSIGQRESACSSYDRALEASADNTRHIPTAQPNTGGYASIADAVALHKKRAGCAAA